MVAFEGDVGRWRRRRVLENRVKCASQILLSLTVAATSNSFRNPGLDVPDGMAGRTFQQQE